MTDIITVSRQIQWFPVIKKSEISGETSASCRIPLSMTNVQILKDLFSVKDNLFNFFFLEDGHQVLMR